MPWNKGRKHSPETIEKIRQRTAAVMEGKGIRERVLSAKAADKTKNLELAEELAQYIRDQASQLATLQFLGNLQQAYLRCRTGPLGLPRPARRGWAKPKEPKVKVPVNRGPRSAEHRQAIADAIRAKWQVHGTARDRGVCLPLDMCLRCLPVARSTVHKCIGIQITGEHRNSSNRKLVDIFSESKKRHAWHCKIHKSHASEQGFLYIFQSAPV